jgi:hypothetical protein
MIKLLAYWKLKKLKKYSHRVHHYQHYTWETFKSLNKERIKEINEDLKAIINWESHY